MRERAKETVSTLSPLSGCWRVFSGASLWLIYCNPPTPPPPFNAQTCVLYTPITHTHTHKTHVWCHRVVLAFSEVVASLHVLAFALLVHIFFMILYYLYTNHYLTRVFPQGHMASTCTVADVKH